LTPYSLYRTSWCSFCARVEACIEHLGLEVELRDIDAGADFRRELAEATGRETVPCLRTDSPDGDAKWLFESARIVAALEEAAAG
jgi:glutathione S-transferase